MDQIIEHLPTIVERRDRTLVDVDKVRAALEAAISAHEILKLEAKLDAIEGYMRDIGLYDTEEVRPLNEIRMLARWKLGRALKEIDRTQGKRTDLTLLQGETKLGFRAYLKTLKNGEGLPPRDALFAQRIGAMPEEELRKEFEKHKKLRSLCNIENLIDRAKPYWQKERRAETRSRRKGREIIPPDFKSEYKLIKDDFRNAEIEPGSVDCIITDPPYPEKFVSLYADLAVAAEGWLKPGGSLLAMAGETYLPRVLAALASGPLNYQWTIAYLTPGGQASQIFPRKVNSFWKPVFWFVKGKYEGEWTSDVFKSDINDNDKAFHEWGQSESGMTALLLAFSKAGDLVCDPFLGGGTTAIVALRNSRKFIGIEQQSKAFAVAKRRIKDLVR